MAVSSSSCAALTAALAFSALARASRWAASIRFFLASICLSNDANSLATFCFSVHLPRV